MKFRVLFLSLGLAIAGCSGLPLDSHATTYTQTALDATKAQAVTLKGLHGTVSGLTPDNLPTEKPKAIQETEQAQYQNVAISKSLTLAVPATKKDAAKIAASTDMVKVRLDEFSLIAIGIGVLATIAGFFFAGTIGATASPAVIKSGLSLIATGVVLYSIASFLHDLRYVVGGVIVAALVGAGVYVALHWSSVVETVQAWYADVKAEVDPVKVVPAVVGVKHDAA
jgi:hypothetical protein